MSMLRSTIVRRCRADVGTVEGVRRYAQAARLASEADPEGAGPSSAAAAAAPNPPKQRREAAGEGGRGRDYRFPTVGRRGGPPDPFEVLGLDRSADPSEVKRQYYRLALLLHPDSAHPSSSHDNFATLHRAYTLLSKPRSRTMYLSHGYGWGTSHSSASEDAVNWADARMRAEVRMRREGGAAAWHGGSGAGAGWGHSHAHAHARDFGYDSPLNPGGGGGAGKGEERFMSNRQFLILTGGVSLLLAVGQYHRIGVYAEKHQDLLHQQHLDASHALAQARQEAAAFGKERRDRIRRRVREAQVIRETEEMERRGGSWERTPGEQSDPL